MSIISTDLVKRWADNLASLVNGLMSGIQTVFNGSLDDDNIRDLSLDGGRVISDAAIVTGNYQGGIKEDLFSAAAGTITRNVWYETPVKTNISLPRSSTKNYAISIDFSATMWFQPPTTSVDLDGVVFGRIPRYEVGTAADNISAKVDHRKKGDLVDLDAAVKAPEAIAYGFGPSAAGAPWADTVMVLDSRNIALQLYSTDVLSTPPGGAYSDLSSPKYEILSPYFPMSLSEILLSFDDLSIVTNFSDDISLYITAYNSEDGANNYPTSAGVSPATDLFVDNASLQVVAVELETF